MNKKIIIGVVTFVLLFFTKNFVCNSLDEGARRSKEHAHFKSVGVHFVMYMEGKLQMHLPKHNNFKKALDLNAIFEDANFIYHYDESKKYSEMSSSRYKILSFDGFVLYGDGHVEDHKEVNYLDLKKLKP